MRFLIPSPCFLEKRLLFLEADPSPTLHPPSPKENPWLYGNKEAKFKETVAEFQKLLEAQHENMDETLKALPAEFLLKKLEGVTSLDGRPDHILWLQVALHKLGYGMKKFNGIYWIWKPREFQGKKVTKLAEVPLKQRGKFIGKHGSETMKSVLKYQTDTKTLIADGVAGEKTLANIVEDLKKTAELEKLPGKIQNYRIAYETALQMFQQVRGENPGQPVPQIDSPIKLTSWPEIIVTPENAKNILEQELPEMARQTQVLRTETFQIRMNVLVEKKEAERKQLQYAIQEAEISEKEYPVKLKSNLRFLQPELSPTLDPKSFTVDRGEEIVSRIQLETEILRNVTQEVQSLLGPTRVAVNLSESDRQQSPFDRLLSSFLFVRDPANKFTEGGKNEALRIIEAKAPSVQKAYREILENEHKPAFEKLQQLYILWKMAPDGSSVKSSIQNLFNERAVRGRYRGLVGRSLDEKHDIASIAALIPPQTEAEEVVNEIQGKELKREKNQEERKTSRPSENYTGSVTKFLNTPEGEKINEAIRDTAQKFLQYGDIDTLKNLPPEEKLRSIQAMTGAARALVEKIQTQPVELQEKITNYELSDGKGHSITVLKLLKNIQLITEL